MAQTPRSLQLKPQAVAAFDEYIREAEAGMEQMLHESGPFLWSEASSERAQLLREGKVVAQFWAGQGPVKVPNGLIHAGGGMHCGAGGRLHAL